MIATTAEVQYLSHCMDAVLNVIRGNLRADTSQLDGTIVAKEAEFADKVHVAMNNLRLEHDNLMSNAVQGVMQIGQSAGQESLAHKTEIGAN